jgi:hypothetical protein
MMDDIRWMDRSRLIDRLDIEIFFQLNRIFYLGDPNNSAQISDRTYREPFALPAFPVADESSASTAEIVGHEPLLADYYQRLLERASQVNKGFDQISQYFWMSMSIWNEEEDVHIGFSWYDHLSEMSSFIEWLATAPEADLFVDVDQGWQVDGCVVGDHIHLREVDPDTREERANVAVPRAALVDAARQVEHRAAGIIALLTEAIGTDYWTYPRSRASAATGVSERWPGSSLTAASMAQQIKTRLMRWFKGRVKG